MKIPNLTKILRRLDSSSSAEDDSGQETPQKENLQEELGDVISDSQIALCILKLLFPEFIPINTSFYSQLNKFITSVGWNSLAEEATGCIWSATSETLATEELEALLRVFPSIKGHAFFKSLRSLPHFVARVGLRPDFAAEWLPSILRRIGNDLAGGVFWDSLGLICERHPATALGVLRNFFGSEDEHEVSIAAYLMGSLRAISRSVKPLEELDQLEAEYCSSTNAKMRSVYRRSWVQSVQRGQMSLNDFQKLAEQFQLNVSEGQHEAFWIVCRALLVPTLPSECRDFCLTWLKSNVSGGIAPEAKYCVVDCVTQYVENNNLELLELVISIQPIPKENAGSWGRFEHLLVSLQNRHLDSFKDFFVMFAQSNARGLLAVMQEPRSFEWLFSELSNKDLREMVGILCFSGDRGCRKLGLHLFEKLGVASFPDGFVEKIQEHILRLTFFETQITHMNGGTTAKFLISLIPRFQNADESLQASFHEELVLQAKNYSGLCLEEFERNAEKFPLLQRVTEEVNCYFEKLKDVHKSSICAMDVPGYRLARRNYARRFNNEVTKGAEELSIFSQICKKVRLLYGRSWRTFMEGNLSESTALKEFSNSIEMPRMEFIDPEGMAFHRLFASAQIEALTKGIVLEEEA